MVEIIKDLRLMSVEREEDYQATLKLADLENKLIYDVTYNQRVFDKDTKKWKPDVEKQKKVEQECLDDVGHGFDELEEAVGENFDVYVYDGFNKLHEVEMIEKFCEDDNKKSFSTIINDIVDTGTAIVIKYKWKGKPYQSKMTYADYNEGLKEWFVNPQTHKKQLAKFKERYGVPFEEKDTLIGKNIIVNVKCAFGKFYYGEISLLEEI